MSKRINYGQRSDSATKQVPSKKIRSFLRRNWLWILSLLFLILLLFLCYSRPQKKGDNPLGSELRGSFQQNTQVNNNRKKNEKVYVCFSNYAYAYHKNKNCTGLNNCTHKVSGIKIGEAINKYKLKPCKLEYDGF